jgi:DNA polymerase-3 subunit epsilon
MAGADFVVIDVETANADMASICQIGLVAFRDGAEIAAYDWLVDPEDEFDPYNVRIHGIDESAVRGCPTFAALHPTLAQHLSGALAVCHTHFDRVSLAQACRRYRREAIGCTWLDSARVARRVWLEVAQAGYGLANLASLHDIRFQHHNALDDARTAGLILLKAIEQSGVPLADWLHRVELPIGAPASGSPGRREGLGTGPLAGETVVFTGALTLPRAAAADRAHALGAAVTPGVTRHTTLLVVGNQDARVLNGHEKSGKHRKAETMIADGHPIRIITEADFMEFV